MKRIIIDRKDKRRVRYNELERPTKNRDLGKLVGGLEEMISN